MASLLVQFSTVFVFDSFLEALQELFGSLLGSLRALMDSMAARHHTKKQYQTLYLNNKDIHHFSFLRLILEAFLARLLPCEIPKGPNDEQADHSAEPSAAAALVFVCWLCVVLSC